MSSEALDFSLSALDDGKLTTMWLTVTVGDEAIWPVEGARQIGLEVQIDDLLSHLTEFWKPLVLRQTYPVSFNPERPSMLRAEAERRWESQPGTVVEREDEQIVAFEEAHDLSRCFAGVFDLPPLWLLRAGDTLLIDTRAALRKVPFDQARSALAGVGDKIAKALASTDDRWSELIAAWHARDRGDPSLLLAWSTGLDRDLARSLVDDGTLTAPPNVTEAANDNDELRLAARMASALPPEHIRQIIALVRKFPKYSAPKLDGLAVRVRTYLDDQFSDHRAYEQGEAAARFARELLDLPSVRFIDIFSLLESLGAGLHSQKVEPSTLDALAVWGAHHGPAVLLNSGSIRIDGSADIRRSRASRVTLAHEFCHLLLDRGHALSAVDVLNSRMPLHVERRAKAFAGELLLPSSVAADAWFSEHSPRSPEKLKALIETLCRRYGITKSVAAWKLEHGLHHRDIDLRIVLDAIVPQR